MKTSEADRPEASSVVQPLDYKKGFGWTFLFNLFTKITTPLVALLIVRRTDPDVFGMYALVQTALLLADSLRESGLVQVYMRETRMEDALERGYARLSVQLGAVLALILLGLSLPAGNLYGRSEVSWGMGLAAVAMSLNGASTIPFAKMLRRGLFRQAGLSESIASVGSSLYALGMIYAGFGFFALASQMVVRSVIFAALAFRFAPCGFGGGDRDVFKRILRASGSLTGVSLLWSGYSVGDQAIVSKLFGLASGGVFSSAKLIVGTADVLAKPIMQTAMVAFSHRVQDPVAVQKTLGKALTAFLLAVAPVYASVALLATPLVNLLLPPKYASTAAVLPAVCAYFAAIYPGSFASSALVMAGRQQVILRNWLVGICVISVALALSREHVDLPSLAWLFTGGLWLVNTGTLMVAMKHYRFDQVQNKNLLKALVALSVSFLATLSLHPLPLDDGARVLSVAVVMPVVHLIAVGSLFVSNPFALFSPSGMGRLWRGL